MDSDTKHHSKKDGKILNVLMPLYVAFGSTYLRCIFDILDMHAKF